jgi:hypothetical protein
VITYHLAEGYKTRESKRKKEEKKKIKDKEALSFPDWETLKEERLEEKPKVWLTIRDEAGNIVRKINAPVSKGFHRVAWDLRHASREAIDIHEESSWSPRGHPVLPGKYTVTLAKEVEGELSELAGPLEFNVVRLFEGALEGMEPDALVAYRKEVKQMRETIMAAGIVFEEAEKRIKAMEKALSQMDEPPGKLYEEFYALKREMAEFKEQVFGDPAKRELSVYDHPSVNQRMRVAIQGAHNLNYGPTVTQQMNLEIARNQYEALKPGLKALVEDSIPAFEKKLVDAGAPWMSGRPLF